MGALLIGIGASVVVLFLSKYNLIETWELKTYDTRMGLTLYTKDVGRGTWDETAFTSNVQRPTSHTDVVLFYVDEPSLAHFKEMGISWPWPRELYPSALSFCRRGGARAVVFDLFYSEESVYGVTDDEAFADGVKKGPPSYFVLFTSQNVASSENPPLPPFNKGGVGGFGATEDLRISSILEKSNIRLKGNFEFLPKVESLQSLPIPQLVDAATGFGNAQAKPDVDGIYRRVTLLERYDDKVVPSISLKVVADTIDAIISSPDEKVIASEAKESREVHEIALPAKKRGGLAMTTKNGTWNIPLDDDGRMMIHYYGPADTLPVYPLAKVMQSAQQISEGKTPDLNPEIVKDKIVVIGVAAPGLYDLKPMPLSRVYPGPEIHATVIENLLRHEAISPVSPVVRILLIVMMAFLATFGLALIGSFWGVGLLVGGIGFLFVGGSIALFARNVWIPVVQPVIALGLASFGMMVRNYLVEGRKKREIKKAFGQYLSPDVVSEIAKNPDSVKMGGSEAVLTVFFSDIANFTSISEKMTPPKLVADLNCYLTHVTRIILEHEGTLDKYIGDAVMAFWGAPLFMPYHEKKAVLSAIAIQQKLEEFPHYVTRIGIHTGPVVVGNIGSEQRFNYTAIGDTVNLASRLEGLNKKFGTRIIMSEITYDCVRDEIAAREIGRVRVKGRAEPVGIYEPLGRAGTVTPEIIHACEIFADGLTLFRQRNFPEAKARFERASAGGKDSVSDYYLRLCDEYLQSPPKEFDGVITFETK